VSSRSLPSPVLRLDPPSPGGRQGWGEEGHGGTYLQEKPPYLVFQMEMPMGDEVFHEDGHAVIMVIAIGINLLGLKKIKLANLLPGLIFAVLYALLFHALKLV